MVFALAIAAYFYIRLRNETWPPNLPPPLAAAGARVNTFVLLASAVPNETRRRKRPRGIDLAKVRLWLVVCLSSVSASTSSVCSSSSR